TGVGKDNYRRLYPEYARRVDPSLPQTPVPTHNTPAQIAAETGILGLLAFMAVMLVAVLGLRKAKHSFAGGGLRHQAMLLEAVEVAIYGYLVTSLFLHDTIYQRYLWLLIGLAAIGRQVALKSAADRPTDSQAPATSTRSA